MAVANFLGVHSDSSGPRRQGSGASRKRYFFVWDDLRGGFIIQSLNAAYQPVGEPKTITKASFQNRYRLETNIYVTPLTKFEVPDLPGEGREPDGFIGEGLRKSESERRLIEAAKLDQNLRDEFAIALSKLRRGDRASAVNALERLANRREGILPAHKHTFTDFAVNLRKSRLPAVAFKFYQRALELSPEDSNAYFNMARIMFDLGDYEGTEKHLQQALNLDVDFDVARRFLDYLGRYLDRRDAPRKNASSDYEPLTLMK